MKNNSYLLLFFISLTVGCSNPSKFLDNPQQNTSEINQRFDSLVPEFKDSCSGLLAKTICSSDFFQLHRVTYKCYLSIDDSSDNFTRARIYTKGDIRDMTVGWVQVFIDSNKIKDETLNPDNPVELKFDLTLLKAYQRCVGSKNKNYIEEEVPEGIPNAFSKDSGFILNWHGSWLYKKPNKEKYVQIPFNSKVQILDTTANWVKISYGGKSGYIRECDFDNVPMTGLDYNSDPSIADSYQRCFSRLGKLTKSIQSYSQTYTFISNQVNKEKAYQILKLFLKKSERDVLPSYLPKENYGENNADFRLEISVSKNKYLFSFLYSGGETTATINQNGSDASIEISYNYD